MSSFILLPYGCKNSTRPNRGATPIDKAKNSTPTSPAFKPLLYVSAHLIYDDGSLSSFDVLHDNRGALWNVIIGEGAAEKPSRQTEIAFEGRADSFRIRIRKGRTLALDTNVIQLKKPLKYTLHDTGCDEVFIYVLKNKKVI